MIAAVCAGAAVAAAPQLTLTLLSSHPCLHSPVERTWDGCSVPTLATCWSLTQSRAQPRAHSLDTRGGSKVCVLSRLMVLLAGRHRCWLCCVACLLFDTAAVQPVVPHNQPNASTPPSSLFHPSAEFEKIRLMQRTNMEVSPNSSYTRVGESSSSATNKLECAAAASTCSLSRQCCQQREHLTLTWC